MTLIRRHVHSLSKTGSTQLLGDVTLSEGSNIALTQSEQNVSVAVTSSPTFSGLSISGLGAGAVISDSGGNLSSEATLAVTRGGTSFATYSTGDIIYASSSSALNRRNIGSTGDVLTVALGVPAWAAPAGGATPTWKEDSSTVVTSSTIDFLEPDTVLLTSTTASTVTININKYALLAGRSGGQTLIGGTGSGNTLTLNSTSHATKSTINLDDKVSLYPSQPTVTTTQSIFKYNPTYTNTTASGSHFDRTVEMSPIITLTLGGAAIVSPYHFDISPVITYNSGLAIVYRVFNYQGTYTSTANPGFASSFTLFNGQPTLSSSVAGVSNPAIGAMYLAGPIFNAGNAAVGPTFEKGYQHAPVISCTGASSTMTMTLDTGFESAATFNANTAGSALTITARRGLHFKNFATTLTGTVVLTANIGVDIDATTVSAGNLTNTLTVGVRSALAANANTYFLQDTGGAKSEFAGKFTRYNNIATVSNGVPSELATVDLTTQAAAIADTTIYTPTATGMFRLSVYLQVTRAATTSSILGGATGVVIKFNDGAGNVAQTVTMALNSTTGTVVTTAAGNTTATNLNGTMVIYARTGVAISYAIGYTSVGVTSMQAAYNLKVEAL